MDFKQRLEEVKKKSKSLAMGSLLKKTDRRATLDLAKTFLKKKVKVVFDRPSGSRHPKHGFLYEVNYGYIPGVRASDGENLDAYYLGVAKPLEEAEGVCVAIIHRKDDDDDKLIVVPDGLILTDEEIHEAIKFQEQWFESSVIR